MNLADVTVSVTMTQPNPDAPAIVLATNLMHNGGFNLDATGWEPSYGTGTIEQAWGTLQATGNGSNSAFAVRTTNTTWSGLQPGQRLYVRALVRTIGGQTPTGTVGRVSFDGNLVRADGDVWNPQGVNNWHALQFSVLVPDDYTGGPCHVIVGMWLPSTTTSNDVMQVDDVIVSTSDVAFFDGSSDGTGALQYRWVGTPNNSPSEQYLTGDALTVNTTDATAAFLGEIPSAVRTMTAQWQQASSRDHPTPGKLTLELILDTPEHAAIDYESEVVVMLSIRGREPLPFWRGWVDDIEITRRVVSHPDTREPVVTWTWNIGVGDVLARAAATKINDAPWPKQPVFSGGHVGRGRLNAIQEASPIPLIAPRLITGVWVYPPWPDDWVRPRDVDNTDVLSLCQSISPIGARQVHESYDGVTFRGNPGINELAWFELYDEVDQPFIPYRPNRVSGGVKAIGPGSEDYDAQRDPNTTTIPSSAIIQTSRRINRATMLNEVSIGWYDEAETARDSYRRNTTRQASTSQQRIATDYIAGGPPPMLVTAADAWLSMTGRPTRALSETQLITGLVDTDSLTLLCTLGRRGTVGIGIADVPDDLPSSWRVIAGTATVVAGRLGLDLTLEPASLSGQEPMTWDELPGSSTAKFSDGTTARLDLTFRRAHTVPYDAFSHVTKSAVRLYDGPH